jgi:hypothetical protein
LYDEDLSRLVLEYPASHQGCQTLCIVSGYAEPSMVSTHLDDLLTDYQVHIQLLVGMFPNNDWNGRVNEAGWERYKIKLRGFRQLTASLFGRYDSTFECRYVAKPPQLHTKLYIWLNSEQEPTKAFVGSPNYTQKAFSEARQGRIVRQGEIVTNDDNPEECYGYFQSHWEHAQDCNAPDTEERMYSLRNRQ